MEYKTIKTTALVIILSILSVISTFAVYYFTNNCYFMIASTILISLILSHMFLEASLTYETNFLFSCLSMILSSIITALIYFNLTFGLLSYQNYIHIPIYLYWIVPIVYYIFRTLLDKGPRFVGFSSYFSKSSIIFLVYYIVNLVYHTIIDPIMIPYGFSGSTNNFIPFFSTAIHIEDFIYMGTGIEDLLIYIIKLFILFVPIGFYASLFLEEYAVKSSVLVKIILAIFIPIIFECVSYLHGNSLNIDSCLYRFFGIFIGIMLFKLLNIIFVSKTGEEFLVERNRYSFFY